MAATPRKNVKQTVGSRAQVMNRTALRTPGGLTRKDLKYNKQGRIVSRKKSMSAKRDNRLVKAGYVTTKGEFGSKFVGEKKVKKSSKKRSSKKRSSKKRSSKKGIFWF
jgi:hypothetical protein